MGTNWLQLRRRLVWMHLCGWYLKMCFVYLLTEYFGVFSLDCWGQVWNGCISPLMSSIPDWHWEGWHLSMFGLTINYFKCITLGSYKLWFIPDFKISNTFTSISLDLLRIDSDEHDGAKSRTSNCLSHIHISHSFKYLLYFQFVELVTGQYEWAQNLQDFVPQCKENLIWVDLSQIPILAQPPKNVFIA